MNKASILDEYAAFLKSRGIAPGKHIPFWISWVMRCSEFCLKVPEVLEQSDLDNYIESLLEEGHRESWQVEQAGRAGRVFIQKFLKKIAPSPSFPAAPQHPESAWTPVIESLRNAIRRRHYSYRTEQTYIGWVRRFAHFVKFAGPETISKTHVEEYLTYLAVRRRITSSTQNQAFCALLFLFRNVFKTELGELANTLRAKKSQRLPVVLSREEIQALFQGLNPPYLMMAKLLYGCGLRLRECLRLRIKDLDFSRELIFIHAGKGNKDRTVPLPRQLAEDLAEHVRQLESLFAKDRDAGFAGASMAASLERKYPQSPRELKWQYCFPAANLATDPRSQTIRRHHITPSALQKRIKKTADQAGLRKRVTCHTLRHSFATHLLEDGTDIRTIQELLGHADVHTTMIYTHVAQKNKAGIVSPLDRLLTAGK